KAGTLAPIEREVRRRAERAHDAESKRAADVALAAVAHAGAWLAAAVPKGPPAVEAGARRLALTLGRALQLALLVHHAAPAPPRSWCRGGHISRMPWCAAVCGRRTRRRALVGRHWESTPRPTPPWAVGTAAPQSPAGAAPGASRAPPPSPPVQRTPSSRSAPS